MTKKKTKNRRVPTWTFQPDDQVVRDFEKFLKRFPEASKSEYINYAARIAGEKAADVLAAKMEAEQSALRKARGE